MYFKKFEIKGFRGIKRLQVDDLKDINLILGKNNCGKTSLLEAIFLLIGVSNPQLIVKINQFRDLLLTDSEDLRYIYYNLDYTNELTFKAYMFRPGSYRELNIKPSTFFIPEKENEKKKNDKNNFSTSGASETKDEINELKLIFSVKEENKKRQDYEARLQLTTPILSFSNPKNYNEKMKGYYITPRAVTTDNIDEGLDEIVKHKMENEIIEVLKKVDNKIQGIKFGKNLIYLDIGLDTLIPLNLAGDGIRRILSVILGIYRAKNGILLIDEFENGLHFSTLKSLWNAIIESSRKFNVQIFITTHNFDTLKYLNEALEESTQEDKERVTSITLRKFEDGNIKAYNYDYEKFEYSLEQGIEIR